MTVEAIRKPPPLFSRQEPVHTQASGRRNDASGATGWRCLGLPSRYW